MELYVGMFQRGAVFSDGSESFYTGKFVGANYSGIGISSGPTVTVEFKIGFGSDSHSQ